MIAHKVVNALRGRGGGLMEPRAVWQTKENREAIARKIEAAQKFNFGNLMLERAAAKGSEAQDFDEKFGGRFVLPELTKDEAEFFREGLVPLPFKMVWYEFVVGKCPSGLLIEEMEESGVRMWRTQRLEYDDAAAEVLYDGMMVDVHLTEMYLDRGWCKVHGNKTLMSLFGRGEFSALNYGANAPLAYYLTLMLSSRTTMKMPGFVSPPKVAAAQRRKGRCPLPPHTVVRIVPDKFRQEAEAEGARSHRPPRLHWRRSHLRHYDHAVPSAKFSAATVHDGKAGWWVTVIPRMLVGRAELGEVSHEYQVAVQQPEKEAQS